MRIICNISSRYCYAGKVSLTPQTVLGLLVLADKYDVPSLKEACSNYMISNVVTNCDEVIAWYQCAKAYDIAELEVRTRTISI